MGRLHPLLILVAALVPQVVLARQRAPVASSARLGELVRVRDTDAKEHRGTLAFAARDSLIINDAAGRRTMVLTPAIVTASARRPMSRRARMARGALVGFAIGAAFPVGTAIKLDDWTDVPQNVLFMGASFGAVGGVVGAISHWQHWERVGPLAP